MVSETLMEKLLQLRIPAFREGLRQQMGNPQYAELSFEERLLFLVEMECARRLDNRTKRRLKLAAFPIRAAIEDIDFSPERGLDRRLVLELSQSLWIDKARNIIVSGATGTGKTYLASAVGYAACKLGYSVRYYRTARFLHDFNIANRNETFLSMLKSLSKVDLLILDDWMRDPIQLSAAQSLLELFDDRFGHTSTIIVSQVPLSEWHTRFPDPTLADAILDRTIHNAYRLDLKGESQRKLHGFRSMPHT